MKSRRKFTPEFKAKIAIEAIKEYLSLNDLGAKHKLSPQLISRWKKEFLDNAAAVFKSEAESKKQDNDVDKQKLYEVIGQQKIEIDFLKKALS